MSEKILNITDRTLTALVAFVLLVMAAYAAFALWDNNRVYAAAQDVQQQMLNLKPDGDRPSFDELLALNPDVCAWVTLDGTKVDYPVVQGSDNLEYLNKDVYGSFALAGSIFLDTRCDRNFGDAYSLLYGHHMADGSMFGSLDSYKDAQFFNDNATGTLLVPDGSYDLQVFACLTVTASDDRIFDPTSWQAGNRGQLASYVRENALHVRSDVLDSLSGEASPQVLALCTCSSDYTEARTVVLATMKARS